MKTYIVTPTDVERKWFVVDATGKTLGRLASRITPILRGKHKPIFTPRMDVGDYVIVINAEKVAVTGQKRQDKMYYHHTQYPGGFRSMTLGELLEKHPTRVIELAVRGMLPKNRLGRAVMKKLKVYAGDSHPHEAQQPQPLDL
ncbi:MAG: 50S ribosomal protein L13 [Chloroflexota bacterium]|nr:50S ribosomal protein L13 [Chloroflexota bacterium]